MKLILTWILPFLLSPALSPRATFQGKAFDASQPLDLTPSTAEEIDLYYQDVDTSLSGDAFIASLYETISADNHFVSYSQVNDWYKVTDRNDSLSQAIDPATYDFDLDKEGNYFLVQLYSSQNDDPAKAYNTDANKITGKENYDPTLTRIDWENGKKNNVSIQVDREHCWAKSHGFEGDPVKGAGTDLHHLIAADHNTNSAGHNDNDFGEVDLSQEYKEIYSYNADGTKDLSGYLGVDEDGHSVFEPMDEWKGDVARALLYMGTRYSSDVDNSKEEPHLVLTDDFGLEDDNDLFFGVQHGLSTFLEWNELDPVDDYERQRNDRIAKNVQNNRNPYVDHPEWARKAYAPETELPYDLSSLKDRYDGYVGEDFGLDVRLEEGASYTATSSDEDVVTIAEDGRTVHPRKEGEATITYEVQDGEETLRAATTIAVHPLPTLGGLPENTGSYLFTLEVGQSQPLSLVLQGGRGETLRYRSTDEEVATCDEDGTVHAVGAGECQIEVSIDYHGRSLLLAQVSLSIQPRSVTTYVIIIAVCAVLLILFFVILALVGRKKKKGRKVKDKELTKRRK